MLLTAKDDLTLRRANLAGMQRGAHARRDAEPAVELGCRRIQRRLDPEEARERPRGN